MITTQTIYKRLTHNIQGDKLYNLILLSDKKPEMLPLIYFVQTYPNKIIDLPVKLAYQNYFYWCDENMLDPVTQNKFTRHLQGERIMIQQTYKNREPVKLYYKADDCPTCRRPF